MIFTGIGAPCSKSLVLALNCLQNSMIDEPRWPSAGPIGGEGLAWPAGHLQVDVAVDLLRHILSALCLLTSCCGTLPARLATAQATFST